MATGRVRTLAAVLAVTGATLAVGITPAAGSAPPLTPDLLGQLSSGPKQPVIVLLRDQHRGGATTQAEQDPLINQVRAAGASRITQFHVINAFAATVSAAERSHLSGDPRVAAVVPDLPVHEAGMPHEPIAPAGTAVTPGVPKLAADACPADPARPQLEPEALGATNAPQAQNLATGKGVKVAFLADGLDTGNPDFVRADGSKVFADYQDFTGEGTGTPTDSREAFGDASSIAAQGRQTYDLSAFVSPGNPLPVNCNINVRGMAPGSSLVGLKVISSNGFGSTSGVVRAIDYAVNVAHVDVINESLGSNPYPDSNSDPFTLANRAAVAAGVTVVASAGDAGYGNTVGSPASDPTVITAGASTTYRVMAQTRDSTPGFSGAWHSDNVSAISSSGIAQNGRVDDLVAPGDENWALCTADLKQYTGCRNYRDLASPVQVFGGTSEAAPLVAGAAALVIESYAATHGGAKPSPSLVKELLTSTATDQGDPADRQGAGLLDALAAVRAAKSIKDGDGAPAPQADGLLFGTSQLLATAAPNTAESFTVPVNNYGTTPQTISVHGRALSSTLADQRGSVVLDTTAAGPSFTGPGGIADDYVKTTFTVPAKADHLDASIAWSGPDSYAVTMILLDPSGAFAGYTMPQSATGPDFGHIDVHAPAAGSWTALIYSPRINSGFAGPVSYRFTSSAYAPVTAVTSDPLTLAPGQSSLLKVHATTPATPGDLAATVELDTAGQHYAMPLVLRSLVGSDGAFAGTLTGGNGRGGGPAQVNTYQFDVAAGQHDIGVSVTLAGDVNQVVFGYLVSPDGQVLSQASTVRAVDAAGSPTAYSASLQSFARDPAPGRWSYVVALGNAISGSVTSQRFSGQVRFNTVDISAHGLPSGAALPAGKPVNVTVHLRNTGAAPANYFVDARGQDTANQQLIPRSAAANVPLAAATTYVVPPDTAGLIGVTSGTVPVSADMSALTGDPEVLGPPGPGNIAVAFVGSPAQVGAGRWAIEADPVGPLNLVTTGTANLAMVAVTKSFDPTVTSSTGDPWLGSVEAQAPAVHPVPLDPGAAGDITVTFTPAGSRGTQVSGVLYVDTASVANDAGDELIALPYSYIVG